MENNFEHLVSLWRNYNNASSLLTKAIGGTANEVGEFAEILVANYYCGEQLPASNKSADIKTKDGKLIQVKARKVEKLTATSLNVIRSWDFTLWKERNSTRAEESHRRCIAELEKTMANENATNIHEVLASGLAKRIDELWERLPRDELMAYCKDMPDVLKQYERYLDQFLVSPIQ